MHLLCQGGDQRDGPLCWSIEKEGTLLLEVENMGFRPVLTGIFE